ncbi:dynein regulatory complex protein 1 homolog [Nymphalis io]|uniref:dynein regulatory complex protein 1 homolog n=1 Tax=Inachis io TaxID=171585 RepID=UPI002167CCD9|nr:dynein regulatory complex protein 1 homolog [Nymphalis io]
MESKFGGYNDEDEDDVLAPKEPQVTSEDPNERKAARALRIKRRQEALKRAEQPLEEIFKEEEPGHIEQATTAAAEELQRLALDGAAKVTNVKVTTDEREVIRRALFSTKMRDSMAKIEAEASESQIRYDAISANWDFMLGIKDPLDIDAAIKEQKRKCEVLLEQKDKLINELKHDLKNMDNAYYEDLDKQDKDIKELSDRIEKQLTIMQRAYEKQLFLIEQAINIEREIMVDHNNKRWEALYKQRDKEEIAHMEYKFEQLDEHKLEMEAIMWDHHAKYREAKIELETLIQELQKELEKLKATCIINTEKIGYNYQVWRMSVSRCNALCVRVRRAETALHAHVLAEPPPRPPPPPPKSPLTKYDPVNTTATSGLNPKDGKDNLKNVAAQEAKDRLVRHILQLIADNTGFLVEDRLLKLIEKYPLTSRNLCTLDSIFMALEIQAEEDIELLCKIFLNYAFCPICIGLETASEMVEPSTFAVTSQEESHHVSISVKGHADRSSTRIRSSVARSISASTSRSVHVGFRTHDLSPTDQLLMAEADEIIQKCGDPKVTTAASDNASEGGSTSGKRGRGVTVASQPTVVSPKKTNPFLCPLGHFLEIESMQVLTALNEFMAAFVPPEKRKLYDILDSVKTPDFGSPSRKLNVEEIEQYWSQWKNLFSPEKDRFWDGLLSGLNNYLTILQERERIHEDVLQLRQRNASLRGLVRGTLPELPHAVPRYTRPRRTPFVATSPDSAPPPFAKLSPI